MIDIWINCPVCGKEFIKSLWGMHSHLRMHVRRGEMKEDDSLAYRIKMWPKRDKLADPSK